MPRPKKRGRPAKADRLMRWEEIVANAMPKAGEALSLSEIYVRIDGHVRTRTNQHWKAKVRQTLQLCPIFERVTPGVWIRIRNPRKPRLQTAR